MSYFKKIGKSLGAAGRTIAAGAVNPTVGLAQLAKEAKVDTGAIADKVGLGQYDAKAPDIDESVFKDTKAQDAFAEELRRRRSEIEGRDIRQAERTKLGPAEQMSAAQIGAMAQAGGTKIGRDDLEFRKGQQGLIADLTEQAAGRGPSLAGMQLDDARAQQIETAMALAASQRGLQAGQGLRSIANQTQEAGQFAAREAAKMRIAEQLAAREQLGGALQGARGQDMKIASNQAALDQQTSLANQAALNQATMAQAGLDQEAAARNQAAMNQLNLSQGSLDQQLALANLGSATAQQAQQDAYVQALSNQIGGLGMMGQENLMDLERMKYQGQLGLEGIRSDAYGSRQRAITGLLTGGAQGLATYAAKGG